MEYVWNNDWLEYGNFNGISNLSLDVPWKCSWNIYMEYLYGTFI